MTKPPTKSSVKGVAPTASLAERQVKALEDIAEAMQGIRTYLIDVSLWLAHIGRNQPPARKN